MELLLEIKDKEIPAQGTKQIREAARAILFDENNLTPLLFVSKHNYYKIPGGGIEDGEDTAAALIREVMEETGSTFRVTGEVGKILEYRSKFDLVQTSYCYLGKIINKGEPTFTEDEISDGFKMVWLPLDQAITAVADSQPDDYEGSFIQKRDLKFLQKAKELV